MNKKSAGILACLSFFTFTSSTALYAGNQPGAFTLTVGAGELFLASKRHMQNAGMPLVILGYDFTTQWGFEALIGGFNTEFNSSSPPHSSKQINGTLVSLNGVYRFMNPYFQTFQPYVVGGIGVLGMNPNGTNANNEGNINAGVGTQIFIHKLVAFRLEARDLYTWVGGKNDVLVAGGVTFLLNAC